VKKPIPAVNQTLMCLMDSLSLFMLSKGFEGVPLFLDMPTPPSEKRILNIIPTSILYIDSIDKGDQALGSRGQPFSIPLKS